MKRTNGFRIALFAFATMLFFTQCAKQQSAEQSTNNAATTAVAEKSIKVAFVDIDSLLSKYEFSIILNKEMLRKEVDMRMKLSEKAKALQADYDDFQRKLQNNVYATRERAEEEQARILKQKDLVIFAKSLESYSHLKFSLQGINSSCYCYSVLSHVRFFAIP